MKAWEDLVNAALLGTDRASAVPDPGLLPAREGAAPEARLLDAAAALALYRRAARRAAPHAAPLPEPARPERLPAVSDRAGHHLGAILHGPHGALLPEWLDLAARAGRRAPHLHLPALLDAGRARRALRPALLPVLGEHGAWLAAANPAWAFALGVAEGGDPEEVWQTGGRDARAALLRDLRERDPARARALLAGTWRTEAPDDREVFLAALIVNLAPDDEPFVEAALDDRRKDVRRLAAELLAHLPGSALVARQFARLAALVDVRRGRLDVTLPAACDAAMVRDGVEPKPPSGTGERAWWLQQVAGAVPPERLGAHLGLAPADLVRLAQSSEWAAPLLIGLAAAAVRAGDAEHAALLLPAFPEGDARRAQLQSVLPPERRRAAALAALARFPVLTEGAHAALFACAFPWDAELARAVLRALEGHLRGANPEWSEAWRWRSLLDDAARLFPPDLADEAAAALPDDAPGRPGLGDALDRFLATLAFRREMRREFR